MTAFLDWLLDSSTLRGAVGLLTAVGVKIRPDMQESILSAGVGTIGLINVIRKGSVSKK